MESSESNKGEEIGSECNDGLDNRGVSVFSELKGRFGGGKLSNEQEEPTSKFEPKIDIRDLAIGAFFAGSLNMVILFFLKDLLISFIIGAGIAVAFHFKAASLCKHLRLMVQKHGAS